MNNNDKLYRLHRLELNIHNIKFFKTILWEYKKDNRILSTKEKTNIVKLIVINLQGLKQMIKNPYFM